MLGTAGAVVNMFKVVVKFELDTDFTLAQASLPVHLMAKIVVIHDKYMVCQTILTQEMTREDLVTLVTGIRKFMDGPPPKEAEFKERALLCQSSKKNHNVKISPTLVLSDQQQKSLKD